MPDAHLRLGFRAVPCGARPARAKLQVSRMCPVWMHCFCNRDSVAEAATGNFRKQCLYHSYSHAFAISDSCECSEGTERIGNMLSAVA